ncbi:MAG TPA: ABC transporter permease subunit [Thermoplasmata archaeon]|nr:ABC transporter permease subunit [Thermoplasmata archaeon]
MAATANVTAPVEDVVRRRESPDSLSQAFRLARYQLRDYLLSQRFILMLGIVAALGVIITTVVAYFRPASLLGSSNEFYSMIWAGGVTIVIVFAGVIFGGDAIAGEFQNKTGYFLMGLPLRRSAVYIGKYVAAFTAAFVALVVFAAILVGNGVYYFGMGAFTVALFVSFVLAVVYLLALLGATFLFSSLFKTSTYAVLVVAVMFIFGFNILSGLVEGLWHIEPWFIISYASAVISYPFDATIPAHVAHIREFGGAVTVFSPTYVEGVIIMLGYFACTAVGGLLLFEREEFT